MLRRCGFVLLLLAYAVVAQEYKGTAYLVASPTQFGSGYIEVPAGDLSFVMVGAISNRGQTEDAIEISLEDDAEVISIQYSTTPGKPLLTVSYKTLCKLDQPIRIAFSVPSNMVSSASVYEYDKNTRHWKKIDILRQNNPAVITFETRSLEPLLLTAD